MMAWNYPSEAYKEYKRNPLVSTDIELRFPPILAVTEDPSKLVELQNILRKEYPEFTSNKTRSVALLDQLVLEEEKQHVFSRREGKEALYIGNQSIRASSQCHKNKTDALRNFKLGLDALNSCFGDIGRKRLGVRYVNIINKSVVANDLNLDVEELQWHDLINENYLTSPGDVVDLMDATFATQIKSSHKNGGDIVLRYGLAKSWEDSDIEFRFDVDRCTTEIKAEDSLDQLINDYALDIFSLFHTMVGDKLKEWMQLED